MNHRHAWGHRVGGEACMWAERRGVRGGKEGRRERERDEGKASAGDEEMQGWTERVKHTRTHAHAHGHGHGHGHGHTHTYTHTHRHGYGQSERRTDEYTDTRTQTLI